MKIEKYDSSQERHIVTACIVDDLVLAKISTKWDGRSLSSKWANLVVTFCVNFYRKYSKAPKKSIEHIFISWANKNSTQTELVSLIERYLESLSGEYELLQEDLNQDYLIDLAGDLFNKTKLSKLVRDLELELNSNSLTKAQELINSYSKIDLGVGSGIDVLQDYEAINQAFEHSDKPALIEFDGSMGKFLGRTFSRDCFVAFLGCEKSGKSYYLLDIAWRAVLQRRKVAFFEAGDMTQDQAMLRFMVRVSERPLYATKLFLPKNLSLVSEKPVVESELVTYDKALNRELAKQACEETLKHKIKSKQTYLKLSCHPNSTLSVRDIKSVLATWERELDWFCDMCIIDYADILCPLDSKKDFRHQNDETWRALRALSQEKHILVVTATQANSLGYGAKILTKGNVSEDKRKNAHITALIGINQSSEEKNIEVYRLNFIDRREAKFIETHCCYVAGCLSLANPYIKSCLG